MRIKKALEGGAINNKLEDTKEMKELDLILRGKS